MTLSYSQYNKNVDMIYIYFAMFELKYYVFFLFKKCNI